MNQNVGKMNLYMQNEHNVGVGASRIQPTLEHLVTKGSKTELNHLSHTRKNSLEYFEIKNKMQNESSVGAGASSIQPTLVLHHYRGPQH
jgi:hypothetical protein